MITSQTLPAATFSHTATPTQTGTPTPTATAIAVDANTQYDVYTWMRGEVDPDDSERAWLIRAMYYNSSGGYIGQQDAVIGLPGSLSGTWVQNGGRLTTLPNTASMRIQLYTYMHTGWVAWDDVEVYKVVGGVPTGGNLAVNPGFESSGNWSQNTAAGFPGTSFFRSTWGTASPHSGSYGYAISNQVYGHLESNSIPVRAGTDYDLYAWVRGEIDAEDSYGDWIIRAQFYTGSGTPINPPVDADRGAWSTLTTTFTQQGGRVTAPANAASVKIVLLNYMNSGWVAWDDVTLSAESIATSYYYAGGARVAMRQGNGTGNTGLRWLLGDHLGSTSVSTDGNGTNPITQLYKAWGEVRWSSGSLPTRYTYTGQYSHASEFGFQYYGARWYDSYLNRWTSPDSIIPDPYNPLDWDRYSYVRNNPVKYIDPNGHISWPFLLIAGGIGIVVIGGYVGYTVLTSPAIDDPNTPPPTSSDMSGWLIDRIQETSGSQSVELMKEAWSGNPVEKAGALQAWVSLVRGGGAWDFKPDIKEARLEAQITLGGVETHSQAVANIFYGFIGSEVGLDPELLQAGAGAFHLWDNRRNLNTWGSLDTWGDDSFDNWWIQFGIYLHGYFKDDVSKLTKEELARLLREYAAQNGSPPPNPAGE